MTATVPRPSRARTAGLWWLALTALAIAAFGPLRYLTGSLAGMAADGNQLAANYVDRPGPVLVAFYAHVAGGGLALLLSPVQLSARLRARVPRLHRVVGRIVLVSIGVGGIGGLVLATTNLAGPIGTAGFGILAVLWISFAGLGLRAILHGEVAVHRRWMIRTFALTYAAVMLRLWMAILVPATGGDFLAAYAIVPFLCWVPNLAVAEWLLRRGNA